MNEKLPFSGWKWSDDAFQATASLSHLFIHKARKVVAMPDLRRYQSVWRGSVRRETSVCLINE